jgi:putative transposase
LIPCKTPNKNAHIESYHSILEEECLGHYEFYSYLEAYEAVTQFRKFYNQQRIHSGVNYMSPSEFYEAYYRRAVKLMPIAV